MSSTKNKGNYSEILKQISLSLFFEDTRATATTATAATTAITVTEGENGLSTIQKILYGVLMIGGEWGWARINRLSVNNGWGDRPEVKE